MGSTEKLLSLQVDGWNLAPIATLYYQTSWIDEHLPKGAAQTEENNRGEDFQIFDDLVRKMDKERLARLNPHVSIPLLALARIETLEELRQQVPANTEASKWEQLLLYAEIHKAAMILDSESAVWIGTGGKFTLTAMATGAFVAYVFSTYPGPIFEKTGPFLGGTVALFTVAVIAAAVYRGMIWEGHERRERWRRRQEVTRLYSSTLQILDQRAPKLAAVMQSWNDNFWNPQTCLEAIASIPHEP